MNLSEGQTMWTTVELAREANCDSSTVRKLLIAGRLKGVKRGRDWFVADDEAKRWLSSRREGSKE